MSYASNGNSSTPNNQSIPIHSTNGLPANLLRGTIHSTNHYTIKSPNTFDKHSTGSPLLLSALKYDDYRRKSHNRSRTNSVSSSVSTISNFSLLNSINKQQSSLHTQTTSLVNGESLEIQLDNHLMSTVKQLFPPVDEIDSHTNDIQPNAITDNQRLDTLTNNLNISNCSTLSPQHSDVIDSLDESVMNSSHVLPHLTDTQSSLIDTAIHSINQYTPSSICTTQQLHKPNAGDILQAFGIVLSGVYTLYYISRKIDTYTNKLKK